MEGTHASARSSSECLIEQTPTNNRVVIEMEKWVHVALVYRFYRVPPKPSTMDVYVNAQHICRFGPDPSDAGGVFERSSFVGDVCLYCVTLAHRCGRSCLWVAQLPSRGTSMGTLNTTAFKLLTDVTVQ